MLKRRRKPLWIIAGTLVATLTALLLAMNLGSGEKKIERRIERPYALDDPRFANELGVLLGPAFLPDKRILALRNGDRIFPAMLNNLDADFARQQSAVFFADLALSRRLTYAPWQARLWQE